MERLEHTSSLVYEEPPKKVFVQKVDLPILSDYKKAAPKWFWNLFPGNKEMSVDSLVDGEKLRELAEECGYPDKEKLNRICDNVKFGAKIGCKPEFRKPTRAGNAPFTNDEAVKITDAIADWCKKGFAAGPFDKSEVPKDIKVNSLMTRPKPNGGVRVILNLSAPAKQLVNDGINTDDFPAIMSSTLAWLRVLKKAGKGCVFIVGCCDYSKLFYINIVYAIYCVYLFICYSLTSSY